MSKFFIGTKKVHMGYKFVVPSAFGCGCMTRSLRTYPTEAAARRAAEREFAKRRAARVL